MRATVGKYAKLPGKQDWYMSRLLRACVGPVIYCDTAALHVAKYRHVFARGVRERRHVHGKLDAIFEHMAACGLGHVVPSRGEWPCFVKEARSKPRVVAFMKASRVPVYSFPKKMILTTAKAKAAPAPAVPSAAALPSEVTEARPAAASRVEQRTHATGHAGRHAEIRSNENQSCIRGSAAS